MGPLALAVASFAFPALPSALKQAMGALRQTDQGF